MHLKEHDKICTKEYIFHLNVFNKLCPSRIYKVTNMALVTQSQVDQLIPVICNKCYTTDYLFQAELYKVNKTILI